ncbi:unnamed protein product [Malus baccata var. baccata]
MCWETNSFLNSSNEPTVSGGRRQYQFRALPVRVERKRRHRSSSMCIRYAMVDSNRLRVASQASALSLLGGGVEDPSWKRARPRLVPISISSLVEHLEDLIILLFEDLILHRYLVILSLQLIDFSLKSNPFSFFLSLPRTKYKKGVILLAVVSFPPHVGEGCLVKRECTNGGNQPNKVEESGDKCRSHRRRQMLMHKISEDFGTTESVKFVTFARLLRSLLKFVTTPYHSETQPATLYSPFYNLCHNLGEEDTLVVPSIDEGGPCAQATCILGSSKSSSFPRFSFNLIFTSHHGEKNIGEQNVAIGEKETGDEVAGMHNFLNDVFVQPLTEEGVGLSTEPPSGERCPEEVETFFRLLEEADQDLWPGCKEFKKLEEVVKKLIIDLGLTYVKIDACPNDCMIYWKDTLELIVCSVCGESRYKITNAEDSSRKKITAKHTAEHMRWHATECPKDEFMRHPSDSPTWKHLDNLYLDFALEIRNVRLGLARSRSLGKEIDVYMRPLIDELNELWEVGTPTYDAYSNQSFTMKVVVLWTISDFPAYEMLSGCSTHGYKACPHYMHDKESIYLPASRKICYMGHRRFLEDNDRQLCSKKESKEGFKQLNSRIALTLCQLEKIFPPAFFDIMVHLPVHLADEAVLAEPVQYRWMYPIEWYLQTLKHYVRNKVLLLKHIWWMSDCPSVPCILEMSSLVAPVKAEMKMVLDVECLMNSRCHPNDMLISQDLRWLANYPSRVVSRYKSHIVHGFKFRIKSVDDKHKNQNCGVFVPTNVPGAIGQVNCHGRVVDMFEVKYCDHAEPGDRSQVVMLFKCEWVNSESPRGMKTDQYGFTMVNFNQLGFKADPFILASQELQAFYVEDTTEKDWHVVVQMQPRDLFDVLEDSDAIEDYAIPNLDDQILDHENFHTRVGVEETHFHESLPLPTQFASNANADDDTIDDDME